MTALELRAGLELAVRTEDYATAAKLKKQIDALEAEEAATSEQAAVSEAVALVKRLGASIDDACTSAGDAALVVLFYTAAEHALANALVSRAASEYAGSQLAGGPACAFLQISESGVDRLGMQSVGRDPSVRAARSAPPASQPRRPEVEAAVEELRRSRGIESLPTTHIWRAGELVVRQPTRAERAGVGVGGGVGGGVGQV